MPLGSPQGIAARLRLPDVAPRAARSPIGLEAWLVFLVSAVVAFPRTGHDAFRGVMWAEDGSVTLQAAYQAHHGWTDLLTPYQGYAIVLPRLVSSVVSYLPVSLHGLAVVGSAALLQAAIALLGFHVASSHTSGRIAGWTVALGVAAVPVGPETVGALVNLQWFLLFAACIAPLWEPRTAAGRGAVALVLAATALSGPFGLIPLAVVACAWYLRRGRHHLVLLWVSAASVAIQLVIMATAPPRQIPVKTALNPFQILDSYVRRVLGDGVLGLGRYADGATSSDLVPGVVVAVLILALTLLVARSRGVAEAAVPVIALVLSLATFAGPVGVSGATGPLPPMMSGRYSVGPALLLVFAVALLVGRAAMPDRTRTAAGAVVASRFLAVTLLGALAYGLVTSWTQPEALRVDDVPSWSSEVARGRALCEHSGRPAVARLHIAPAGWSVAVPCSRLGR